MVVGTGSRGEGVGFRPFNSPAAFPPTAAVWGGEGEEFKTALQ